MKMFAAIDSCFIIDWASYGRSDILCEIFKRVFISTEILDEIKSKKTLDMIVDWIGKDYVALIEVSDDDPDVIKLISEVGRTNGFPAIDHPEATALVLAKRAEINIILSENKATISAVSLDDFKGMKVWTAFEVIREAILRGLLPVNNPEDIKGYYMEYCRDTGHEFRKERWDDIMKILNDSSNQEK